MHFNTKYIFQGDSKDGIVNKINYNFNQIVSFAVGPNGLGGIQGPTGFRGPAGSKGVPGGTGTRSSSWYKQASQPQGSVDQYDVWVNTSSSEGQVFAYSATGSWNFTGFSIFDSTYFFTYSWILGPAGSTDKYVIGLADTANAASQTLVISDESVNVTNSNPNKSKVVVSTADQTIRPIFSFGKSGAISTQIPSFYWGNTGNSNDIIFSSNGQLEVSSFLKMEIDSSLSAMVLKGNDFNSTSRNFNLRGIGNFDFSANTTVGGGSIFSVASSNLTITPQAFSHNGPIRVSGSNPGGYVMNDFPSVPQLEGGVSLSSNPNSTNTFRFDDLTGSPIFSGKPFGTIDSGKFAQTVFGSTGGNSGGTGGPFFYHVQKTKNISLPVVRLRAFQYQNTSTVTLIQNIIDISSPSYWDRNMLIVTPTSLSSTFTNVYLKLPSTYLGSLPPVYSPGRSNYFRVLLNTTDTNPSTVSIAGIVFVLTDYSVDPNNPTEQTTYVNFSGTQCKFIDFQWISLSNQFNQNPRLFYKTCTGEGNYLNLTNYFAVGAIPPPPPLPSDEGGGGDISGGGGGGGYGGGCFLPGTQVLLADGTSKRIDQVEIGEIVFSYDFENSIVCHDRVVSKIFFEAYKILDIVSNGTNLISSTQDHPYWVPKKGWCSFNPSMTSKKYKMRCMFLEVGDTLINSDLEEILIEDLILNDVIPTQTLTLETEKTHNFFASGVLVHNKVDPDRREVIM